MLFSTDSFQEKDPETDTRTYTDTGTFRQGRGKLQRISFKNLRALNTLIF
jgi:hypothetical protein